MRFAFSSGEAGMLPIAFKTRRVNSARSAKGT
jgi:hypothetical protein